MRYEQKNLGAATEACEEIFERFCDVLHKGFVAPLRLGKSDAQSTR